MTRAMALTAGGRIALSMAALLLTVPPVLASPARAGDISEERITLKGIKTVKVVVRDLHPDAEASGAAGQNEKNRNTPSATTVTPDPMRISGAGFVKGNSIGTATTTHPNKATNNDRSRGKLGFFSSAIAASFPSEECLRSLRAWPPWRHA